MNRPERLMALAVGLLAAAIVAILVGVIGLTGQRSAIVDEIAGARAARLSVNALMQGSIDAETGQRGYLLTDDPQFLEPYEAGRQAALRELANLHRAVTPFPQLRDDVDRADALAQRAFGLLAAPLERRPSRQALRAMLLESKTAMDALRIEARALLQEIELLLEASRAAENRAIARLYWLGGALALLGLVAVAIAALALYQERKSWRATFSALSEAGRAAEDARERAAASDLAKSRFLAVASHDMRQPLHALSLYLSALDRRVENPEARGILVKMERATDSMISMFATLLDLARIQAGAVAPEIADFPLQDVFDRLVAENPGAPIAAEPTSLNLHTDPVLLERALRNLVANALKHGGDGVRLSARARNDRAEIAVADNGPGIAPDDQERIFDEFVRLGSQTDGLGLGLAIVRGIAQALDMPLEVRSAPGHGATFIVRPMLSRNIPVSGGSEAVERLDAVSALVVDDEQMAREAITRSLTDGGAHVRSVADEAKAELVLEEGFRPNLLVMDLRLDGEIKGVEIARRLRNRVSPPPHVIVVTGDTAADTLAMLRDSGFAWLIKPVNPRELLQLAARQFNST